MPPGRSGGAVSGSSRGSHFRVDRAADRKALDEAGEHDGELVKGEWGTHRQAVVL